MTRAIRPGMRSTAMLPSISLAMLAVLGCPGDGDDPEVGEASLEVITEYNATIAAGKQHSCALGTGGTVRCWGRNDYGQLGNGTTTDSPSPVTVSGISNAEMVTAGDEHSCAVLANGTARCWGRGGSGQLGNNSTANRTTPVTVSNLTDVTSIAAGGSHTCASLGSGQVRCWGANGFGQLGNNSTVDAAVPQTVLRALTKATFAPLDGVAEVDAGKSSACARRSAGTVACWGRNQYGQLGVGSTTDVRWAATVSGITSSSELAVGDYHACAVVPTGRARCWGFNLLGQLGDGTQSTRTTPVEVRRLIAPGLSYPIVNVSAVTAGFGHTCMRSSGDVWCMGDNDHGQLGQDISPYVEPLAEATNPLVEADEIAAGADHTCVREPDGGIVCFGDDAYGQVGIYGRCPSVPTAAVAAVTTEWVDPFPWPSPWPTPGAVLSRPGGIFYTTAGEIDIRIETTACAVVTGLEIEGGPSDDFEVLSTVDRPDRVREITVRAPLFNAGTGQSYPVAVEVTSPAGNPVTASFTLAEVDSINQDGGTIHLTRDQIMNDVLAGLYEKWGDGNYYTRNGVNLYDLDYAGLDFAMDSGGIVFHATTKADLIPGPLDGDLCNPTIDVFGAFRVVVVDGRLAVHWDVFPGVDTDFPNFCEAVTLGLTDVANIFIDIAANDNIARKVNDKIDSLTENCTVLGCDVVIDSVTHVDGGIRVVLNRLPSGLGMTVADSVTVRVPYTTEGLDAVSPEELPYRGLALPPDEGVLLVSGGVAEACALTEGSCETQSFGAEGLFNWNWTPLNPPYPPSPGPHPPIPTPWPDCEEEVCPYYHGRHGPWLRQIGLRRDGVRMVWRNPGSVIARILHDDGTASQFKYLGDMACGLGEAGGDTARLAIGRNDTSSGGPFNDEFGTGAALVTINFVDFGTFIPQCPQ